MRNNVAHSPTPASYPNAMTPIVATRNAIVVVAAREGKYFATVWEDGGEVMIDPSHMNNAEPTNIGKPIKNRPEVKLSRLYSRKKRGCPKKSHPGIGAGGRAGFAGAIATVCHCSQVMKMSDNPTHSVLANAPHLV